MTIKELIEKLEKDLGVDGIKLSKGIGNLYEFQGKGYFLAENSIGVHDFEKDTFSCYECKGSIKVRLGYKDGKRELFYYCPNCEPVKESKLSELHGLGE